MDTVIDTLANEAADVVSEENHNTTTIVVTAAATVAAVIGARYVAKKFARKMIIAGIVKAEAQTDTTPTETTPETVNA